MAGNTVVSVSQVIILKTRNKTNWWCMYIFWLTQSISENLTIQNLKSLDQYIKQIIFSKQITLTATKYMLIQCRLFVAMISFGFFRWRLVQISCTACQPSKCLSSWFLHTSKQKLVSWRDSSFRTKFWIHYLLYSWYSVNGMRTGTRWLFPLPVIYTIFIDFTSSSSMLSKYLILCWSSHSPFFACTQSVNSNRAGSPPLLPHNSVSRAHTTFLSDVCVSVIKFICLLNLS